MKRYYVKEKCFNKIKHRFDFTKVLLILMFFCVNYSVIASDHIQQQKKQITGTIVDISGESIIGANVIEKGTTNGTVTDANGRFSLSVDDDAVLEVTYIGYLTQEVNSTGRNTLNIIIEEDTQALDEVLIIGYGTQRKETLTGAVSSISASDIVSTKSANTVINMQGKIPGLLFRPSSGEPGDFGSALSIRGFGTPVIVIDGVVRDRSGAEDLAQLNSDDIESISMLKDASAAIYGMNAANGVIIVTTKKGRNEKVSFSYSGMMGVGNPVGLPEIMTAYEHRLITNEMQRNVGNPNYYSDEILEKFKNGEPGYTNWDWIDMYFHKVTEPKFTHNLSARGGTDKLNFFTSLGYTNDKGIIKSNIQNYERYTLRSNISAELTNNLDMNLMISGRMDNRQAMAGIFFDLYRVLMINDRGVGPFTETGHYSAIPPNNINPASLISIDGAGYRRWRNTALNSQIDFTYTAPFLKDLKFNLLGAFDTQNTNYSQLQRQVDLYDYHDDFFVQKSRNINQYRNTTGSFEKAYVKLQANYNLSIDDHSFAIMGAVEASQERSDNLSGHRQYSDIYTIDVLNMATESTQTNYGGREYRRFAGALTRLNYDYKSKYLLEAMVRRDGSYRYAPNRRWATFPSVSVGWRVSEEDFFRNNISFISDLKLRASYGKSGFDQGNQFEYIAAYTLDNSRNYIFNEGEYTSGMRAPGVVNDRLSWVTSEFYNAAFDAEMLNGKLTATLEYFERHNKGLLGSRIHEVPNTFGASFPQENINSNLNKGLELALNYRDMVGDFRYSIGANVTYARTKQIYSERAPFTSQYERWLYGTDNRYTDVATLIAEYDGHYTSLEELETAPLHGDDLGNYLMLPGSYKIRDLNGDGMIDGKDFHFEGWTYNANPPLQFGIPVELGFRSWDLSFLLTGSSLFAVNMVPYDIWGYGSNPSTPKRFEDRWHPEDPNADRWDPNTVWIPGKYATLRNDNTGTSENYETPLHRPKITYVRLKSAEIGYTLPQTFTSRIGVGNTRFFLNGFNLLTFADKIIRQYDPEKFEGLYDAGMTNPSMRSFNFGVNITF